MVAKSQLRIRGPFKRASLNLSVDAIVIFVLAFSMMGVGLFITKLIREKSTPLLEEAFDINLLEKQPTSQDPISIQNELTLKKGKDSTVLIGFYNVHTQSVVNVVPLISSCVDDEGGVVTGLPVFFALPQTVEGSKAVAYKAILKEKKGTNLAARKYICLVEINAPTAPVTPAYASKQVYLNLIS
ncbi:hypothetical protein HYY69_00305 [Candidatus Woesearchaeota archaeon]|nr:hypothetical protein [Candidatus Woesearchaeota archaeon]